MPTSVRPFVRPSLVDAWLRATANAGASAGRDHRQDIRARPRLRALAWRPRLDPSLHVHVRWRTPVRQRGDHLWSVTSFPLHAPTLISTGRPLCSCKRIKVGPVADLSLRLYDRCALDPSLVASVARSGPSGRDAQAAPAFHEVPTEGPPPGDAAAGCSSDARDLCARRPGRA